jgi:hypothetical protein
MSTPTRPADNVEDLQFEGDESDEYDDDIEVSCRLIATTFTQRSSSTLERGRKRREPSGKKIIPSTRKTKRTRKKNRYVL